jgi:S-adenosylmethionine/arginine decarboxylase-like enzyme
MTAVYLLAESHVSIHTYPDSGSMFLDAFTCGDSCSPEVIVDELLAALGGCQYRTSIVRRGIPQSREPETNARDTRISENGAGRAARLVPVSHGVSISTAH